MRRIPVSTPPGSRVFSYPRITPPTGIRSFNKRMMVSNPAGARTFHQYDNML